MNCPDCGLENLPLNERCAFCGRALEARRDEWERLSPALREEFSRGYERSLAARVAWRERLVRQRILHVVLGLALLTSLCLLSHVPAGATPGFLALLMDAGLGATAGFLLNRVRGGEYQGMAGFGGAYFLSTSVKLAAGALAIDLGFAFFVFPGFLAALCFGYLFGLNLSLRRSLVE